MEPNGIKAFISKYILLLSFYYYFIEIRFFNHFILFLNNFIIASIVFVIQYIFIDQLFNFNKKKFFHILNMVYSII